MTSVPKRRARILLEVSAEDGSDSRIYEYLNVDLQARVNLKNDHDDMELFEAGVNVTHRVSEPSIKIDHYSSFQAMPPPQDEYLDLHIFGRLDPLDRSGGTTSRMVQGSLVTEEALENWRDLMISDIHTWCNRVLKNIENRDK